MKLFKPNASSLAVGGLFALWLGMVLLGNFVFSTQPVNAAGCAEEVLPGSKFGIPISQMILQQQPQIMNIPNYDHFYPQPPDLPDPAPRPPQGWYDCIALQLAGGVHFISPYFLRSNSVAVNKSSTATNVTSDFYQSAYYANKVTATQNRINNVVYTYTNPRLITPGGTTINNGVIFSGGAASTILDLGDVDHRRSRYKKFTFTIDRTKVPAVDGTYQACFAVKEDTVWGGGGQHHILNYDNCADIEITIVKNTVQGRIFNKATGLGITAPINTCGGNIGSDSAITFDGQGNFQFQVYPDSPYCVQITDTTGIASNYYVTSSGANKVITNNLAAHQNETSRYLNQMSSIDCANPANAGNPLCASAAVKSWDLASDTSLVNPTLGSGRAFIFAFTPIPIAYPWLQVMGGGVFALNKIYGQQLGVPGSRDTNAIVGNGNKEATNEVIASNNPNAVALKGLTTLTPAQTDEQSVFNFCSTSFSGPGSTFNNAEAVQNFGGTSNTPGGAYDPGSCASAAYVMNLSPSFLKPPASFAAYGDDNIIGNFLSKAWVQASSNPPSCTELGYPYRRYPFNDGGDGFVPAIPVNINNSATASGCPSVMRLNGTNGTAPYILRVRNLLSGVPSRIASGRGTIYVDGNVRIDENIEYNYLASGYNSINHVPNLGVIVNGNVEIAPNVTQIDAAIYAKGYISTCNGPGFYYAAVGNGQICHTQLTVHGALLAKGGLYFGRTFANNATREPAERVIATGQYLTSPPPAFENRYDQLANIPIFVGGAERRPIFGNPVY